MRGTLVAELPLHGLDGIIPAYAGNTRSGECHSTETRDHPRVCGEHAPLLSVSCRYRGSSPRMRGTHGMLTGKVASTGIIPAYAGNTRSGECLPMETRDHPRVCGEHPYRIIPIPEDMGSSPRMRGTLMISSYRSELSGIIPAYAGNTSSSCASRASTPDHPRVCGEHFLPLVGCGCIGGSSPRMRGTRIFITSCVAVFGIIPAYAGNTREKFLYVLERGDHPRVCGEHLVFFAAVCGGRGSSPRMRGTQSTRGRR